MDLELVVGQMGCGYWGPNLLRAFSTLRGCRVKWLAELNAERRAYVTKNFPQVTATDNWQSLLDDPEVAAVIIATPAANHFELTKAALLAGKHVLVEKPLTTRTAEAEELCRLAAQKKLILMVGHTFLYNNAVHYLKDLIDRHELGEIRYFWSQRLNLGKVRNDVNAWWNLAPHDISILLYLMSGEMPVSITAQGMSYLQPGIEDVTFATLSWKSGAMAHVHTSWLDPGKVRSLTLVGSKKMAVYDDVSEDKIQIFDKGIDRVPETPGKMVFDDDNRFRCVQRAGDVWIPKIDYPEPLKMQAEHFIQCVRTGKEPLSGPEHARNVVQILEAGQESLRSGVTRGFGAALRRVA